MTKPAPISPPKEGSPDSFVPSGLTPSDQRKRAASGVTDIWTVQTGLGARSHAPCLGSFTVSPPDPPGEGGRPLQFVCRLLRETIGQERLVGLAASSLGRRFRSGVARRGSPCGLACLAPSAGWKLAGFIKASAGSATSEEMSRIPLERCCGLPVGGRPPIRSSSPGPRQGKTARSSPQVRASAEPDSGRMVGLHMSLGVG
jgi:hypothetical protein